MLTLQLSGKDDLVLNTLWRRRKRREMQMLKFADAGMKAQWKCGALSTG